MSFSLHVRSIVNRDYHKDVNTVNVNSVSFR